MKLGKTLLMGLGAMAMGAVVAGSAMAQSYPTRPVTMIVAYPAGQGTDLAARYFAAQLSDVLGQPVVVENRPGAGGNIGTAYAARTDADGYTILMGTNGSHAMNPFLYEEVGYDALADFEPITATVVVPMAISANAALGVSSMPELIEAANARPDAIDVALPSVTAQLVLELLRNAGVPLNGIRYSGAAEAQAAVMGNQVPVLIDTLRASSRQFGRLLPIAVPTPATLDSYPDLPSVAEQGVEGFAVTAWHAIYAIAGTPPEVRDTLEAAMRDILAREETAEEMQRLGFEMVPEMSREELESWVAAEYKKFGDVIAAAGISAN